MQGLSVRDAAKKIGVSHLTVARAANGETVEVDTLVKIADYLGVPVKDILDVKETPDEINEQISMVLAIEPELSKVLAKIAKKVENKEMDAKVLAEVAAFAAYRLQVHEMESQSVEKEQAVSVD